MMDNIKVKKPEYSIVGWRGSEDVTNDSLPSEPKALPLKCCLRPLCQEWSKVISAFMELDSKWLIRKDSKLRTQFMQCWVQGNFPFPGIDTMTRGRTSLLRVSRSLICFSFQCKNVWLTPFLTWANYRKQHLLCLFVLTTLGERVASWVINSRGWRWRLLRNIILIYS